ncbi:hypothetical protein VPH35_090931 [Triticum aestivum]
MASPRVCVTGGGGYIASWLVKLLLSRGYAVHATVRDPCDQKNAHLMQLEGAAESLSLFKADVLDRAALAAAVEGCQGVFHVASPVPANKIVDPESEIMVPAVKGTLNILEVCSSLKVQKKNMHGEGGGPNALNDTALQIVDVRDVADALLLVYEKPESSGRYICAPNYISTKALLELLKKTHPDYNYVKCKAETHQNSPVTPISLAKLSNLGWTPRALEETLLDSIECYRRMGILQDVEGQTYRLPDIFRHYQAANG